VGNNSCDKVCKVATNVDIANVEVYWPQFEVKNGKLCF